MGYQDILIWLLPSFCGIALKLSVQKEKGRERIVRALIQAVCIGYITNQVCMVHGGWWFLYRQVFCFGFSFMGEFIVLFLIKFRWQILRAMISPLISRLIFVFTGVTINEKNKK